MTLNSTIINYNNQQNSGFSHSSSIGGGSVQERASVVSTYNTSVGATSNESKLWVTPGGAVITWFGDVVSPAP